MLDTTPHPSVPEPPTALCSRRAFWLAGLVFVVVVAVFLNGLEGAFVFDDEPSIIGNRSIRELQNIRDTFSPPVDSTTRGRPLANFTLALNYAVSGLAPWSYHAANILIHAFSAAVLFGVMRRTLLLPALRPQFSGAESGLALAIAGLWAIHPLQAESVTYVVQRVESLAGLCYLLTLFCFIRSVDSSRTARWQIASVVACFLGVSCKEIVVSAPWFVLLYDRTLIAGTFREALRRRLWLYVGLASSWVLLLVLVLGSDNRSGTAGFGTASSWHYLLTQCQAIVHYLRLVLWPSPLVFDYGNDLVRSLAPVLPQALLLLTLATASILASWRRSAWGLLGFWFFAILAPTSSVLPVATQTISEHRMYLPLVAVIIALALVVYRWLGHRALWVGAAVALAWAMLTIQRNFDYQTQATLWRDTVTKRPENWRAKNNLALALAAEDRPAEALAQYEAALRLVPDSIEIRNNRVNTLLALKRAPEALYEIESVLALAPTVAELHDTHGMALAAIGRISEAITSYREARRLKPTLPDPCTHLGEILFSQGKLPEALAAHDEALVLKPDFAEAHFNRGIVLRALGRTEEAKTSFLLALHWKPGWAAARDQLAALGIAH